MPTTIRSTECSAVMVMLFMALELGSKTWKLAFAVTRATGIRVRTLSAGNLATLWPGD
jgi:ABC-type nickel/cobalt efflux system permease component RcnA